MNERNQGKSMTRSDIEEFNLKCIVDAHVNEDDESQTRLNTERSKLLKRRIKKLKSRLLTKGVEYESKRSKPSPPAASNQSAKTSKVPRLLKSLENLMQSSNFMDKLANSDRFVGELTRAIQKNSDELDIFYSNDGHLTCVKLIEQICNSISSLSNNSSNKLMLNLVVLLDYCCSNSYELLSDFLLSNRILTVLELLNVFSSTMLGESMVKSGQKSGAVDDTMVWSGCIQLFTTLFSSVNARSERCGEHKQG